VWSKDALIRAIRATVVIPGLFAFCDKGLGNVQMATFASFGGFATLVLSRFAGSRLDKARAHLGLALTGTVLIVVGTLASRSTAAAALTTVPVAFAVLFAGILAPNAAAGATGALVAFILPVVSAGGTDTIPDRLAGWWMVSLVGTAAVLISSSPPSVDRLHAAAASLASSLSDELDAALAKTDGSQLRDRSRAGKAELRGVFLASPYRPTGIAVTDQALSNLVELLEWCSALVGDLVAALARASPTPEDEQLLDASRTMLRDVATLLRGEHAEPDLDGVETLLSGAADRAHSRVIVTGTDAESAHVTFHARNLSVAVRAAASDCLIASRQADEATVDAARVRWYGATPDVETSRAGNVLSPLGIAARHASIRSVWFINSVRGALALAAAVSVADLTDIQHGFWVVLGTLSVLRTNASSTGATAIRAIAGTAAGFVVGSALVLAIGSDTTALWLAFPVAVFIAAYSPGTAPFAVGQAAFTVMILVLFNILVPVGWRVGVVRVEDVALGCAVSVVIGALFWPRGAAIVVSNDLADAFRRGSSYLAEVVQWVVGSAASRPSSGVASVAASLRLDDALRGLLTEQGTKRVPKEQVWNLVGATMRLRLTAHALAGSHPATADLQTLRETLTSWSASLAGWYEQVAAGLDGKRPPERGDLERTLPAIPTELSVPPAGTPVCSMWVSEHLRDLRAHLPDVIGPAITVSSARRLPWWR
jgi:hypothetical protein